MDERKTLKNNLKIIDNIDLSKTYTEVSDFFKVNK